MKVLGEKSLSSKVIIGLKILFGIISLLTFLVLIIFFKYIKDVNSIFLLTVFLTGLTALYITYKFIQIFINLKNNVLFSETNVYYLNSISNSCFIISLLYLINTITILCLKIYLNYEYIYYILFFSIIFMIVFVVSSIGFKILNEIYKEAINYKNENDLTI